MHNKRSLTDAEENVIRKKMALYLNDYTPVRTIEVSNIEDNISAEYLRGYFEFAAGGGKVSDVTFDESENNGGRVAYVTYLLPEHAAAILGDQNLTMKFTFRQASHQPKLDRTLLQLVDINDHCLLHIASYLLPMDLVNLSQTCERLQSIAEQTFQNNIVGSGSTISDVPEENLPDVLKAMGPYIKSIEWHNIDRPQLNYLAAYCTNVNKLRLSYSLVTSVQIKENKKIFENIKSLELVSCWSLYDNAMKIIVTSSNLKHLTLVNCHKIRGKFFDKWKNCQLKFLKIYNSPFVRSAFFTMCETGRLNSLTRLSLDCYELDADKMKILQLLTKVRILTLKRVGNEIAEEMYSLLHKYVPQIRQLKIKAKGGKVHLKSISDMVSSLTKLTRFSHSSMSWELLHKIRQVRESQRQPPIEIGISRKLFNDPKKVEFVTAYNYVIKLRLEQKE